MTTEKNGPLAVRLIRLTNIGGIEGTLEVPLGPITYLEGENGVGKSSVVDGLAALCGGPVLDLLNRGADEGEVYLELTDDTWFRRQITATGKNTLTAGHPQQGTIGKAASWLKASLAAAALSPAEFLNADDAKAAEFILKTTPLKITADEIAEAIGEELEVPPVDVSGHALKVLDGVITILYHQRTDKNRVAKHTQATVERLRLSIPDEVKDPKEVAASGEKLLVDLRELAKERKAAEDKAESEARAKADAEIREVDGSIEALATESARLEERLRVAQEEEKEVRDRKAELEEARNNTVAEAKTTAGSAFAEREATIKAEIEAVRVEHDSAIKAQSAIENTESMIADEQEAGEKARVRSEQITSAMARLEAVKASKAQELPIDGVGIEDGKLSIDGGPAHRANTARRVQVAFEASVAQDSRVRFIFADDLEHLDTKTKNEVEKFCLDDGIQILGARVTDDDRLMLRESEDASGLELLLKVEEEAPADEGEGSDES